MSQPDSHHPADVPRRDYPCDQCPFVARNADNPDAKFPAERWAALAVTIRDPATGREPALDAPLFGCHKGAPGTNTDLACAGWLARFGHDHLAVRLAVATGRLPSTALAPGQNWPPLHPTWNDVVRAQTTPDDDHENGADAP